MNEIYSFITSKGYQFTPTEFVGSWQEIRCELTNAKLAYKGTVDSTGKIDFVFKDWAKDTSFIFRDTEFKKLSKEEKAQKLKLQQTTWELCRQVAIAKIHFASPTPHKKPNYLSKKGFSQTDYSHLPIRYTFDEEGHTLSLIHI